MSGPDSESNHDEYLYVLPLSENATQPTRATPNSAGFDLSSAADLVIPSMSRAVVPTDLAIALPEGTYGRIAPRSGLAVKHGIDVGGGVIDADYRGPVGVILFNFGDEPFSISRGDRVAQLIIERIAKPWIVAGMKLLPETIRGSGGFGSTGIKAVV